MVHTLLEKLSFSSLDSREVLSGSPELELICPYRETGRNLLKCRQAQARSKLGHVLFLINVGGGPTFFSFFSLCSLKTKGGHMVVIKAST